MEFINNVKNFLNHIYADFSSYISNMMHDPKAMSGVLFIIMIIGGFIILFEKAK